MSDQMKRAIEEGKLRFPLSDPAWLDYPEALKRFREEMIVQMRSAGFEPPQDFSDDVEKVIGDFDRGWTALMKRFDAWKKEWEG